MNDIDKLFKENLQNLEVKPNSEIWVGIAAKKDKKKRRVLPMWWLYGGTAAVLLLGLLVSLFLEDSSTKTPYIKDTNVTKTPTNTNKKDVDRIPFKNETLKEELVVSAKNKNEEKPTVTLLKMNRKKSKIKTSLIAQKEIATVVPKNKKMITPKVIKERIKKKNNKDSKRLLQEKKLDTLIKIKKPKKDFVVYKTTKKKEKFSNENTHNWFVTPVVTSSLSNSFNTLTTNVNQNLQSNASSGNNSISFGVKVAYQISKKFQIQSGVHVFKKDYSTKNILKLDGGFSRSEIPNAREVVLNQKYQYLELPIEVKYQVVKFKKTTINIFTGLSFLFLTENQIIEKTTFSSKLISKNQELNNFNYSGNIGVDFNYSINSQWGVQLSPFLKVEKKSFINTSYQFKPYVVGASIGVNYKL